MFFDAETMFGNLHIISYLNSGCPLTVLVLADKKSSIRDRSPVRFFSK